MVQFCSLHKVVKLLYRFGIVSRYGELILFVSWGDQDSLLCNSIRILVAIRVLERGLSFICSKVLTLVNT